MSLPPETKLWGELPPVSQTNVKDLKEIIKMRRAEQVNTQFLKSSGSAEESSQVISVGNPTLISSIQLNKLLKKPRVGRPRKETIVMPVLQPQTCRTLNKCVLTEEQVKSLLRHAVVLICVDLDFDSTTESVLNLLVDIVGNYMKKMGCLLRMSSDASELRSANDFVDVFDRTLHEMHVPDLKALRQFVADMTSRYKSLQEQALLLTKKKINSSE